MATNTLELSSAINQRYKYDTAGKTPTQIQSELRKKGLQGFVVKVAGRKVTMKVMEQHIKSNRGCMR
ncbi:TPA: hypothetical protein PSJ22_000287 [Staphylococcus aureus]|nr:hypothetical protein [Staphylococcus aureus]